MSAWARVDGIPQEKLLEITSCTYSITVNPGTLTSDLCVNYSLPEAWGLGEKVKIYGTGETNSGTPVFRADCDAVGVFLRTPIIILAGSDEEEYTSRAGDPTTVLLQSREDPYRFVRISIDMLPFVEHLDLPQCVQVQISVLMWTSEYNIDI